MPPPWATAAQSQLLNSKRPLYRQHQEAGTVAFFWPDFLPIWFGQYPDRTYDGDQSWEDRIKSWFRNHSRATDGETDLETALPKPGRKTVVKLSQSTRKLTRLQMYQKEYYAPKWSLLCQRMWKEYVNGPEDEGMKKARITYVNELCAGFLERESEEVKQKIDTLMERQEKGEQFLKEEGDCEVDGRGEGEQGSAGGEGSKSGEGGEGGEVADTSRVERLKAAEQTLNNWNNNIQALPRTIVKLLKELHQRTGFAATILVGGPHPADDGKIISICVDTEVGKDKQTFKKSYANYSVGVEEEFMKYLHQVFPVEERNRRSLKRVHLALHKTNEVDVNMQADEVKPTTSEAPSATPTPAQTTMSEAPSATPTPAQTTVVVDESGKPLKVGPPVGKKRIDTDKAPKVGDVLDGMIFSRAGKWRVHRRLDIPPPRRIMPWYSSTDEDDSADTSELLVDSKTQQDPPSIGTKSDNSQYSTTPISTASENGDERTHHETSMETDPKPSAPTSTPPSEHQDPVSTPVAHSSEDLVAPVPSSTARESAPKRAADDTSTLSEQLDLAVSSSNPPEPSQSSAANDALSPNKTTRLDASGDDHATISKPGLDVAQADSDIDRQTHPSVETSPDVTLHDTTRSIAPVATRNTPDLPDTVQNGTNHPSAAAITSHPENMSNGVVATDGDDSSVAQPREPVPQDNQLDPIPSPKLADEPTSTEKQEVPLTETTTAEPSLSYPNPFMPDMDRAEEKYVTEMVHFLERIAGEQEGKLLELEMTDLKEDVEDMVNVWAGIDRSMGYPQANAKGHKLAIKSRPEQVAWWLGRGRRFDKVPPVDDVMEFGAEVRTWWISLQPEWRRSQAKAPWPLSRNAPLKENWESLTKGGANGLMMVLVVLGWWLIVAEKMKEASELASVVDDVRWVLDEITKGFVDGAVVEMLIERERAGKRGRDGDDEKGGKGKKRRTGGK